MFLVGITWVPGIATIIVLDRHRDRVARAPRCRRSPPSSTGLLGAATCIAGLAADDLGGRHRCCADAAPRGSRSPRSPCWRSRCRSRSRRSRRHARRRAGSRGSPRRWRCSAGRRSAPSGRSPGRLALGRPGRGRRRRRGRARHARRRARCCGGWLSASARRRPRGGAATAPPRRRRRASRTARMGAGHARPEPSLARSLIYWFRDARQSRQLILLPVLPALMLLWWQPLRPGVRSRSRSGPIVASLLPLSAFAALSYDGTAFAAELSRGRARPARPARSRRRAR